MKDLYKKFKELQLKYGDNELDCVFGGGKTNSPSLCLVFMNPTARNIATNKDWLGIKYQWIGTKQVWKFLTECNLFNKELNEKIQSMKPIDWDYKFAEEVYAEVTNKSLYITNLAKCTQKDSRHLDDEVFKIYKLEFLKELDFVKPQNVILFGNQVSSIVLNQDITVGTCRRKKFILNSKNHSFECFSVYYPIGNGFFNANKAIEDIKQIVKWEYNE